jgi:hypothetical protein
MSIRMAVALVLGLALLYPATALSRALEIEPARTRVGLARVHLEIDDLQIRDSKLIGTYEIRIPLFPSKDDRGDIEIGLPSPLDQVIAAGGTLEGSGRSVLDGRTHSVTCAFSGRKKVQIVVDTGTRILEFETRFR